MFRPAQNDYRAYFNWNTDIRPLEASSASIPRHKFHFTELENLAADSTNTYLTDVVGVLTSHTNLQQFNGMRIKVTLWGDSTSELTRNLEANELNPQPVVAVVAGVYVKQYLGKASLSSTNATKIYFDLDIPEVLHIRERTSHRTPSREITIPVRSDVPRLLVFPPRKAGTTSVATTAPLSWLETQGTTGALAARYLLRLEVEDSSGTAFFVSMDSEVQKIIQLPALDAVSKDTSFSNQVEGFATVKAAFESLIGVFQDYLILIKPYNMKFLETPSFTVAKLPSPPPAPTPIISAEATEISRPEDEPVADNEPPRKKPYLQKMPDSASASTVAED
ncbi:hypothetical protein MKW92_017338 [Papaver armeniacum]|nr:hypothetical protein MKW92_017338 [Papaver armeniacum]